MRFLPLRLFLRPLVLRRRPQRSRILLRSKPQDRLRQNLRLSERLLSV